jgi:hypothetical protein
MLSVEVKKLTDLRESFHSISNSNLPPKIKSQFLECILAELRSLLHSAESPPKKQRIKIGTQLMLESEEDQHFELQIRLERRKQKLEELDRKIAAISYRLSKE